MLSGRTMFLSQMRMMEYLYDHGLVKGFVKT